MCSFAASVRLEPRPIFRGGGEKNKGIYYQTRKNAITVGLFIRFRFSECVIIILGVFSCIVKITLRSFEW